MQPSAPLCRPTNDGPRRLERLSRGRLDLVLIVSQRARVLGAGTRLAVPRDNDKNTVVAQREIAKSSLTPNDLTEVLTHSLQRRVGVHELEADEPPMSGNGFKRGDEAPAPEFDTMSEEDLMRRLEKLVRDIEATTAAPDSDDDDEE
jgi:DNA-directed RNA polymerase subunit K/omega